MKRRLLGAALIGLSAAVLVACGGGSSTPSSSLTVVPAKGAIYGAAATAYQVDGKTAIALSVNTDGKTGTAPGKATLNVGSYTGIALLNVAGSDSAQYYDEKLATEASFPATANLVSAVPSVTAGASAGVTPLTSIAAKLSGIDPATLGKSTFVAPGKISADTLLEGAVRTLLLLGLPADFNIFAAPTPATNSTAPTDVYGALLFNLGKNATVSALDLFFNATTGVLAQVPVATVAADGTITVTFSAAQQTALNTFNTAIKAAAPSGITISAPNYAPTAAQIAAAKAILKAAVDAGTAPKASGSGSGSGSGTGSSTGG